MILMTTSAVHTGTAAATLALCIMFFHHHNSLNVTLLNDEDIILVFLPHALTDISTITTATLVRHV